ncbi:MAG: FAD-dependent oxidoreductase [Arcobacter sp.]|nr:MAG: FAD-dependent oxidoreductase [Arcobacter sp.]
MKKNKKIVIVGGGIIGASIAWHLCKKGYQPTIIEKNFVLDKGSSGACEGLMFLQSKKPGIHLNMAMKSIDLFEAIQKDLDIDIEFERKGGIVLIHSKREMEILDTYIAKQKASGADIEMLDAKTVKEMVPEVAYDIKGGSFSKNDAIVNPLNLTHGFLQACIKMGAVLHQNCKITAIDTKGGVVRVVKTTKGDFQADLVINAAGAYGANIAKMVGLDVPLEPRKGEILVTTAKRKILNYPLLSATYIAAKYDPEIAAKGTGFAIEQVPNGNILIGSTREFVGFNRDSTIKALQSITASIAHTLPGLGNLNIIRDFAGLRPYTPDGLPLIGEHEKVKGFFFACGHEGDGITLCAITGKVVSEMINEEEVEFDMSHFHPARFDKKGKKNDKL